MCCWHLCSRKNKRKKRLQFWSEVHNCIFFFLFFYWCFLLIEQDIWQGTQLLAIDATAAMGLLRSVLIGDELTEKEKKTLKRTLTDMASIVPIGVLMLLPLNLFIYCICVWGASTLPKKCYISVYQGKVLLVLLVC